MHKVCPLLGPDSIYNYMVQPYIEGAERINRAFSGIDDTVFGMPSLSLKQRIFSLIQGLVLMIPLVNTIVWLAVQRFCTHDRLADPSEFCRNKQVE